MEVGLCPTTRQGEQAPPGPLSGEAWVKVGPAGLEVWEKWILHGALLASLADLGKPTCQRNIGWAKCRDPAKAMKSQTPPFRGAVGLSSSNELLVFRG